MTEKDPRYFDYMKSFPRTNTSEQKETQFLTLDQFINAAAL